MTACFFSRVVCVLTWIWGSQHMAGWSWKTKTSPALLWEPAPYQKNWAGWSICWQTRLVGVQAHWMTIMFTVDFWYLKGKFGLVWCEVLWGTCVEKRRTHTWQRFADVCRCYMLLIQCQGMSASYSPTSKYPTYPFNIIILLHAFPSSMFHQTL